MKFVQLTDPHFVPGDGRLYGLSPRDRLRPAIADINANHGDAAFVIVTGDLTDDGSEGAYRTLREVLEELTVPFHLVLGNHDRRDGFRAVFPEAPTDADGFVQYALDIGERSFIVLDTLEEGRGEGALCARRLAWLDAALAARAGRPVYVFLHHPPLHVGLGGMDRICLVQSDALADVLARHDGPRHLFFGHLHRPVHGTWRGIPFSCHRAIGHQLALSLSEANEFPGCLEPPAYAVVLLNGGDTIVHVHDYADDSPRFDMADPQAMQASDPAALARLGWR